MEKTTHNIVVVGLGNVGQAVHVPTSHQSPRSHLWGVLEPRKGLPEQILKKVQKDSRKLFSKNNFPALPKLYENFDAILKDDQAEAVILCVPHELHIPMAKQLLEVGKTVFCEKPLCTTSEIGTQFLDYLKENNFLEKFFIGYMWRWDTSVLRLNSFMTHGKYNLSKVPTHIEEFFQTGNPDSWLGKFKPIGQSKKKPNTERIRPEFLHNALEFLTYEWLINVWSHQINLTQFLLKMPQLVQNVKIWNDGNAFSFGEDFGDFTSDVNYAWVKGNRFYRGMHMNFDKTRVNLELQIPLDQKSMAKLEIIESNTPVQFDTSTIPFQWMYRTEFDHFLDLFEADTTRYTSEMHLSSLKAAVNDIKFAESVIQSYQQSKSISLEDN